MRERREGERIFAIRPPFLAKEIILMKKPIHLRLSENMDFAAAEREARKAVSAEAESVTLVSYYDRDRDVVVPCSSTICMGKDGYRVYAESRGADLEVIVNDGQYDLYYLAFPDDVVAADHL
jgi:hypothetical protein